MCEVVCSDHIDYTISRYRSWIHRVYDIVVAIYRMISCTNECTSLTCTAHMPQQRRLIDVACLAYRLWLPLPHVPCRRPIMQRIASLRWGLGDGSCTSGGLNYACRKAHCARRTAQCQSRDDINTVMPVQCPLTLTPACCCVCILYLADRVNMTPVLITKPLLRLIHVVSQCCQCRRRRILCHSARCTLSIPVCQTSNTPAAAWTLSHSVCFTRCSQALQCTGQRVRWSIKVTQTMHTARRPTARPLYRDHCVSYDIAI